MTPYEYRLLMEAHILKEVDEEHKLEKLAYDTFRASSTKQVGKSKTVPVYKTFKSFYDYEKQIKRAEKQIYKRKDKEKNWGNWAEYIRKKKGGGA